MRLSVSLAVPSLLMETRLSHMSRRRAFTLIEAIVAMAVLTTAVMAIYGLMLTSMRAQAESRETELAVQAAGRRLEELRDLPVATIVTSLGARSTFVVLDEGGRPLRAAATAPGAPDRAGTVELCRESGAPGDLPSVLDELGLDLDLDADGDLDDLPGASFRTLVVKITIAWQPPQPGDPARSVVIRSVIVDRAGDGS